MTIKSNTLATRRRSLAVIPAALAIGPWVVSRIRMGVALVVLVATAAAMLFVGSGLAAAASNDPYAPSKEIVEAMVEQFGLTPAEARARIRAEGKASDIRAAARRAAGDAFGGAYFDSGRAVLVVAVTDRAVFDAVSSTGAQPRLVFASYAELEQELHVLDSRTTTQPREVTGWRIDEMANMVVVDVVGGPTQAVRTFVAGLGHVTVHYNRPPVGTMADLIGGMEITSDGAACSLGFNARDGRGNVYVLTAGHCRATPWSGWAGEIGPQVLYAEYPINDYSRILRTNTLWVPTPKIAGLATVLGKSVAAVGTTVCRSGKTSGVRCGTIESTNQTVVYKQYYGTVYGLTTTTALAGKGDSGGPFISSTRQAQGVLSGGSGYGVDARTYFQPLNEILSAYDLTLVTDPGGSLSN